MFTPLGKPRGLPYPLQSQISNENITDDAGLSIGDFVWPEDPTERTVLPLWLSQQEFTAIGSAMDVGADIAYPLQYIEVMWLLLRNTRLKVPICGLIIDCVENDDGTRTALQQLIADYGDSRYRKLAPLPTTLVVAPIPGLGGVTCSKDILYAQCLGIVQLGDRLIRDLLEQFEVFSNSGEVLGAIADGIPVVSLGVQASGINGFIEYANQVVDSIRENYDSDYTLLYEEELSCALFCAAGDDCSLSLQGMIDIVGARIASQINTGSITELMLSIFDLNITGLNVADIYMFFFLNALKLANWLLPDAFGIERFFTVIALINEPNDDWVGLCDTCTWTHTFDFTLSDGGFSQDFVGVWTPGVGWADSAYYFPSGNSYRGVSLRKTFTNAVITSATVEYVATYGVTASSGDYLGFLEIEDTILVGTFTPNRPPNPMTGTGIIAANDISITLQCGISLSQNTDPGGTVTISSVTITGTGSNPF